MASVHPKDEHIEHLLLTCNFSNFQKERTIFLHSIKHQIRFYRNEKIIKKKKKIFFSIKNLGKSLDEERIIP